MVAERGHARDVGEQPTEPSAEKAVGSRRADWRIISSGKQNGRTEGNEQAHTKEYVARVELEFLWACDDILALIDENLIPSASTEEPEAFYFERRGDYYRLLAECATGDAKSRGVDVSTVSQRQAPMIQKVLKTVEVPQVQYIDRIVDVPVVAQCQVPIGQTVEKTVEVRQVLFLDRVADIPVSMQRQMLQKQILELIPEWFNAVKGVVDSEDLPLNVYRETLLHNKILRVIKKNHVTKYLEMLAEVAELKDDRKKSYEQRGKCTKLGIREDSAAGVKTAELLRFNTFKSGDEQFSFEEYVDRMKEGQNDIYCIAGESIAMVSSSSFFENLRKKGYEVPYVADPVDEYVVHQPKEFDGTKPKPTTLDTDTALVRDSICEQLFDDSSLSYLGHWIDAHDRRE